MEGLGEFPRSALNLVIAFLLGIPIGLERERHPGVGTAAAYELYPLAVLLSASSEADDAGTPCSVRTRRPGSEPSLLRGDRLERFGDLVRCRPPPWDRTARAPSRPPIRSGRVSAQPPRRSGRCPG